jgi:hypothetical protein
LYVHITSMNAGGTGIIFTGDFQSDD